MTGAGPHGASGPDAPARVPLAPRDARREKSLDVVAATDDELWLVARLRD